MWLEDCVGVVGRLMVMVVTGSQSVDVLCPRYHGETQHGFTQRGAASLESLGTPSERLLPAAATSVFAFAS